MQRTASLITAIGLALALSACAGSAGEVSSASNDRGEGFEYGAPQETVNEIVAGLEPVTLKFQPAAQSENSLGAISALTYKEAIEERSNGKIEIEIVWGQAIAGYTETNDALRDGRLDIAFNVPPYGPSEMPVFNGIMAYSQFGPSSPITGELATGAMMAELAWNNESFMSEYEDQGLTVLSSMMSGGEYYMFCNENNAGVDAEDWKGRSVRAGSTMNEVVINAAGASPVSFEYTEAYEALQRGTVDCLFGQFAVAAAYGIPEVAPNISHMTQSSLAGNVSNIQLAGSSWNDLPLAYQQIIYDAEPYSWAGWQDNVVGSKAEGVEQANAVDGVIEPLPDDVQASITEAQTKTVQEVESGMFDPELKDAARQSASKWEEVAHELGYSAKEGELTEMDEWYDSDEIDYLPFAIEFYEDVMLPNRPE